MDITHRITESFLHMKSLRVGGLLCISLLMVITIASLVQTQCDPRYTHLPMDIPDEQVRPLRNLVHRDLQMNLIKHLVRDPTWEKLIVRKKLSVGLVDLRDPADIKFARVNGDQMMYAASLPKVAIMLTVAEALENGTLQETREILHDMRVMISKSDNRAASRLMDLVGFDGIKSVLTNPLYDFYNLKCGGGLWVGKRYAKQGKRYPDPLKGLCHGATVTQVCRFYYLLSLGKLVNRGRSEQMLEFMVDPQIHHKFVNTLDRICPDAQLYRKSGTWKDWHSDSVLVWEQDGRRYICTALVEDPDGEIILRKLISVIDKVLL